MQDFNSGFTSTLQANPDDLSSICYTKVKATNSQIDFMF